MYTYNGCRLKCITYFNINLKFDCDHYDEIRLQLNHRFFTLRDKKSVHSMGIGNIKSFQANFT